MSELLEDEAIESKLPTGWEREGEEITRTYEFDDYLESIAYVQEVGTLSEEAFHHPEIIVGYKEVEVRFTTHDAGGITQNDLDMAATCNEHR